MAVIVTDPIYTDPSPASTNSAGRWGRSDFADPIFINDSSVSATNSIGRWGRGSFMSPIISYLPAPADTRQYTYRGRVGGEYVYSAGSPPPGATDVIIVGGVMG